jgi:hypothetical protein
VVDNGLAKIITNVHEPLFHIQTRKMCKCKYKIAHRVKHISFSVSVSTIHIHLNAT